MTDETRGREVGIKHSETVIYAVGRLSNTFLTFLTVIITFAIRGYRLKFFCTGYSNNVYFVLKCFRKPRKRYVISIFKTTSKLR